MLRELLHLIESADGPITLSELSRLMDVDAGVIEGMLNHWVRKERLAVSGGVATSCCAGSGGGCGSCTGVVECPFVARMPRTFSVQLNDTIPGKSLL